MSWRLMDSFLRRAPVSVVVRPAPSAAVKVSRYLWALRFAILVIHIDYTVTRSRAWTGRCLRLSRPAPLYRLPC